jgi:phage/plasmid primase-like uncharacterized protein
MEDELNNFKNQVDMLKKELEKKNNEIITLKNKLKSYTNAPRNKKFYENHADEIKQKAKEYNKKIKEENPEKIKEWSRNAYLKRKQKLEKLKLLEKEMEKN